MIKTNIISLLLYTFISACTSSTDENSIIQKDRNNIIKVGNTISDIKTDFPISSAVSLDIIRDYLVVTDLRGIDKSIHLFNKSNFRYITSGGIIGRGPGEIGRIGNLGMDHKASVLWVPDFGKKVQWKFPLDSIVTNSSYKPGPDDKRGLQNDIFLTNKFDVLDDGTAIGIGVKPLSQTTFVKKTVKVNLESTKIEEYGYEHPEIKDKRTRFSIGVSERNNIYVKAYLYDDLVTVCSLNGMLAYNVYGPDWAKNSKRKKAYFYGVDFYQDNILVSYNGDDDIITNEFKRSVGNRPSKIVVFSLEGNYIKTIDTEYKFDSFCVDEESGRVVLYFESRDEPLGFFNLNLN